VKLPEKVEIFGNLPGKIEFFDPDPRPQISNQIYAAVLDCINYTPRLCMGINKIIIIIIIFVFQISGCQTLIYNMCPEAALT